jgi:NIMA (never in mitosis gene a)-related kinase
MYECCTGKFPFDAQNEGALIRKIMLGKYPPITGPYSSALIQVINSMLSMKPIQRPDTGSLLRNPNLMAKSKVLKVDMNPKVIGSTEDVYTYEGGGRVDQGNPAALDFPQKQIPANPMQASYLNYPPYNMNGPPPQQQQQGPAITPSAHPFAFAPQQQQQAAGMRAQGARPPVGPSAHPFALHGGHQDPWDKVADDLNKVMIGTDEFNRLNQDRIAALKANQELARRNEAKEALQPGYDNAPTPNHRLAPEVMPAAGRPMRGDARPPESSPFALHYTEQGAKQGGWAQQQQQASAWTANYTPPAHGRKRATDLMVTGPSLRGGGGANRPGSAAGGYARANDDATTYISSTTYQRPY